MDQNTNKRKKGIARIVAAFFYSMQGLWSAITKETAFRQEFFLSLVLATIGWYFAKSTRDFLFLISALLFVMVVELLNSSIEKLTDLVQPKYHPLAKIVKDMASSAVFLSLVIAVLVWVAILAF